MTDDPGGSSDAHPRRSRLGWQRLGLRWRLLLIGVAGLSGGLALGGWLLLLSLQVVSERSLDASAGQTASDVAGLIAAGQLPQPVPVAGVQLVQVVDRQDRVRAGSPGVDRLVPLLEPDELTRALSGRRVEIAGARAGLDEPLKVLVRPAGTASDRLSVIVAVPLGDTLQAMRTLRAALLVLFLPLVLGLAAIAWWVIGRTLQPVEALRAGAEEITGQRGADGVRLPVPAAGDEIQRLAATLNGMLDRLEAARRRQQQFVADAAHELRNPLAGMRTQLEVAQRYPGRTNWPELTDDLLVDTELLIRLAEDLLLLAGADEARPPAHHVSTEVPVGEVLARVASRYRNARVPVQLEDAGPAAEGADQALSAVAGADPEDLHRIMTNLVDNAVRHARTRVRLAAEFEREQVRITVIDDGPGIPSADRERVFHRFTRLDDARTVDDGGVGLGLAIVAELVRRHSGRVVLDDAGPGDTGPGLRVDVFLPAQLRPAHTAVPAPAESGD